MQPCYRYRAELDRVVDGDTLDVVIDLGFYIRIKERIRLEGVDTPVWCSAGLGGIQKGLEAKEYVERRLAENGNQMTHGSFIFKELFVNFVINLV